MTHRSIAASCRSMAAPRWCLAAPLAAAIAVTLSCGGDTTAPTPPPTPQPTTVSVTPSEVRLTAGDSAQLAAEVRDQNGQIMAGATIAWTSSDAAIAPVTTAGLVRGASAGSATITATAGQASGTTAVTVSPRPPSPDRDRDALVALYEATNGPGWQDKTNWLTDAPLGQWHGVTTNSSGAVVELSLVGNDLAGALPPQIGNLASLSSLTLRVNALTGSIPPELGNLADLTFLWLSENQLSGTIPPELGNLANLGGLLLSQNQLSGTIPPELGNLANLSGLWLFSNRLTGTIPPELGNLANLSGLLLSQNELAGTIPPELGNLANLASLDLYGNELTGTIPPELGRIENPQAIRLHRNQLAGTVPATLLRQELAVFTFSENAGLCAPATNAFVEWLAKMTETSGDYCNRQDVAALETLYRYAGGANWSDSRGWLGGPVLNEWHGIGADSIGRVSSIDLDDNGLAGRLPADLGRLSAMRELRIGNNPLLTGPLPPTLTALELTELRYAGTGLCAGDTQTFRDWLATIPSHEGTGRECTYADRDALTLLYSVAGGGGWKNSDKWLTDAPVEEWYGVTADGDGSVLELNLDENNLEGIVPAELGSLGKLTRLSLADNNLEGEIPPALGDLDSLRFLSLAINQLTGTIPPELGKLASLEVLHLHGVFLNPKENRLTGAIPPELANLANLTELRLTLNKLSGEIPPELGAMPRLEVLEIAANELTGKLPVELAGLASLRVLDLRYNVLAGPVPPEFGRLGNLTDLMLDYNPLTGAVPAALGNLAQLATLHLGYNDLSGTIPPEIIRMPSLKTLALEGNRLTGAVPVEFSVLERLVLSNNRFTGMVPAALGSISSLEAIYLNNNQLTGGMPAELGDLGNLAELELSHNGLDGPVPAEFGKLAELEKFNVNNNPELEGTLPNSLTGLGKLTEFLAGGTGLCAPADPAFSRWLYGMRKPRVRRCEREGGSAAYLTQAVQSLAFPVPLVAGEPALLRVFVWASAASGERMPPVRARFYLDGSEVRIANIAAPSAPIPTSRNEGDLQVSANASIPASVIQPGLEMVVEIDPDSTLDASLGIARRIPAEGRAPVSVRAAPELDFTIVPFLWREAPDSGIVRLATGLTGDDPRMFGPMNTLLPMRDIDLKVHEAVVTTTNNLFDLLTEVTIIRALEGPASDAYYMGIISGATTGPAGVAYRPGRESMSIPHPLVMAHELGHSFSLQHAPCGGAGGPDPNFPTEEGTIGAWGFDMSGDSLIAPEIYDIMSYCGPEWISDYHFTNAFGYRVYQEAAGGAAGTVASGPAAAGPERTLLLWGGIGEGGEPFLEPAFIADAPPSLPEAPGGEYAIAGHDADGGELFSLSFDMPVVPDGDGRSSFAFTLPARQEWAGSLAAITLSGPGGSFTLDKSSDRAAAILRDPLTGQVRGIFRDAPPGLMAAAGMAAPLGRGVAAALSLPPDLEVLASRGIPRLEDWRR